MDCKNMIRYKIVNEIWIDRVELSNQSIYYTLSKLTTSSIKRLILIATEGKQAITIKTRVGFWD